MIEKYRIKIEDELKSKQGNTLTLFKEHRNPKQLNGKPFAVSSEQNPQKLDIQHRPDYSIWEFQRTSEHWKNLQQLPV